MNKNIKVIKNIFLIFIITISTEANAANISNSNNNANYDLMGLIPLLFMLIIMYFFLIRPQQKKIKKHKEMLKNIKKGDTIITNGGLIGKVNAIKENEIYLEISEKLNVRIVRSMITSSIKSFKKK